MVSVHKYPEPTQYFYSPDMDREVLQHGSIGEFLTSGIEGAQSNFLRCIYRAKNDPNRVVTLLCEKIGGCCINGCCPKDQFWMTGLIILLVFVLIVFCIGAAAMICCYQRSKNQERKERKEMYQINNGLGSEASIYNGRFSPLRNYSQFPPSQMDENYHTFHTQNHY